MVRVILFVLITLLLLAGWLAWLSRISPPPS